MFNARSASQDIIEETRMKPYSTGLIAGTPARRVGKLAAEGRSIISDIGAGAKYRNKYYLRGPTRKVVGLDADPQI